MAQGSCVPYVSWLMLGAIAGDIIGSVHEFAATKTTSFPLFTRDSTFTDDTVATMAVAEWLLDGGSLTTRLQDAVHAYPHAGWGMRFRRWAMTRSTESLDSFGNGAAMRVAPVAFAASSLSEALELARASCDRSHDHPEGIKGAQAAAAAMFLARGGATKSHIRTYIASTFGYDLDRTVDSVRATYVFNEVCQQTVPEAILAFLDSTDFEHAIRLTVSLGGDADTLGAITGGIAQAAYTVPDEIAREVRARLPRDFCDIVTRFEARFMRTT